MAGKKRKSRREREISSGKHRKLIHQREAGKFDATSLVRYFNPEERTLIVGGGDLSFSLSVATLRSSTLSSSSSSSSSSQSSKRRKLSKKDVRKPEEPTKGQPVEGGLVCTVYDSKDDLVAKYGEHAIENAQAIEKTLPGTNVLFGVDATDLTETIPQGILRDGFDLVIFNFPHTGSQRVHENRAMMASFFQSARKILRPGGSVDVTMNEGRPYCDWDIQTIAQEAANMLPVDMWPFRFENYKGYQHRTTLRGAVQPFPKMCKTYKFMPV